jgi:hypothetical protein
MLPMVTGLQRVSMYGIVKKARTLTPNSFARSGGTNFWGESTRRIPFILTRQLTSPAKREFYIALICHGTPHHGFFMFKNSSVNFKILKRRKNDEKDF